MRLIDGFCIREVVGEVIAVPTGEAARIFSGIISLNDVSRFLFEKLQEDQTGESLLSALMEEYEVDEGTARADIEEFLGKLREHGLILDAETK